MSKEKIKVGKLRGAELDYLVAKALGINNVFISDEVEGVQTRVCIIGRSVSTGYWFSPSGEWSDCGRVLDKLTDINTVEIYKAHYGIGFEITISSLSNASFNITKKYFGETIHIALCRAFVQIKLGDEIENTFGEEW